MDSGCQCECRGWAGHIGQATGDPRGHGDGGAWIYGYPALGRSEARLAVHTRKQVMLPRGAQVTIQIHYGSLLKNWNEE